MRLLPVFILSIAFAACHHPANKNDTSAYGSNHGRYITIDSMRIYYEEYGKGTPLLLLHPGLGSIESLGSLIPHLSANYRVIAVDAPGHGRSSHPDTVTRSLLAAVNSKLIDQLQLDSVYVVGWSTGGITALSLAALRPDKVKKVVSGGSNTMLDGLTNEGRELQAAYTIEAVEEDQEWLKRYQQLNPEPAKWKKMFTDNVTMWSADTAVTIEELQRIKAPVLIIRGDRDLITLEHSTWLYRTIPQAQLCVYPNTDHNMPSQKTEALAKICLEFLQGE